MNSNNIKNKELYKIIKEHSILENDGPKILAEKYLYFNKNLNYFSEIGFTGMLENSNFLEEVQIEISRIISQALNEDVPNANELLQLGINYFEDSKLNKLKFNKSKDIIVENLLLPYQSKTENSEANIIKKFIYKYFKDPRIQRYKHNWINVDSSYQQIFTKWLIGRDLNILIL